MSRLERLYEALETSQLTLEALSPRILNLRHRQDQLTAARDEAESQLEQRRVDLPGTEGDKGGMWPIFVPCWSRGLSRSVRP